MYYHTLYNKKGMLLLSFNEAYIPLTTDSIKFFSYFTGDTFLSFKITSCASPSTILTDETNVNLAFSYSSGIDNAPQLHMVERILLSVILKLSCKAPA